MPPQTVPPQRAVRRLKRAQIFYAFALIAFGALAIGANNLNYFAWDVAITHFLQSFNGALARNLMTAVSVPGNRWIPYALTAATLLWLVWRGLKSEAYGLLVSTAGGAAVNALLKILIARPRPTPELVRVSRVLSTDSFPSGHVSFFVCFFGFLFLIAYALLPRGSWQRRAALILTALPVALISLSRIYLGAHWASDTLGAYLWSGLWVMFCLYLYRRWKKKETIEESAK